MKGPVNERPSNKNRLFQTAILNDLWMGVVSKSFQTALTDISVRKRNEKSEKEKEKNIAPLRI